jgi:ubiquinone/menaquinone biosynthesis C-methylase UbiE
MRAQTKDDPAYALGRSEEEMRRLERQDELIRHPTHLLFAEAGIESGMRVLDVGCGAGDGAMLAARMVGPTGRVVGVDVNPEIVETARARAQAAGLVQVSFVAGDIREVKLDGVFDAVIGRLVLLYSGDPATALRAALRALRDGGVAAFYEVDLGSPVASLPESALHQRLGRWINETFARAEVETFMGTKLHRTFLDAGLEAPHLRCDAAMGGGREFVEAYAWWAANTLRSLLPLMVKFGVATEEEVGIETFEERYRAEVLRQGSVVRSFLAIGAWARKG